MIIYDKWDETIDENFVRLIYDTQIMLQSYNLTILWNQNMQVQFRNHCEAEAQSNLQNVYIAMQDNKTDKMNQDEWDRQDRMNEFYQFFLWENEQTLWQLQRKRENSIDS